MVLALDYMQKTGQDVPELAARAKENVAAGYQRLLGFEVTSEPGGFDWWGRPPAHLFLTAYGLMTFRDLAAVHAVDPDLLRRVTAWLLKHQQADGSWKPVGRTGWSTDMAQGQAFNLTAYVAWGLARAGAADAKAVAWLEREADAQTDPYGLALAALALRTSDPASGPARKLVDRLVAAVGQDKLGVLWSPAGDTAIGARGESAAIETTALAIQALLQDQRHAALAVRALERLLAWRGSDGRFGTTQSTILALKALLAAEASPRTGTPATVTLRLGTRDLATTTLPEGSTAPQRVELGRVSGALALTQVGGGRTRAALSTTTWIPWDVPPAATGRLELDLSWPVEPLKVGQPAEARIRVSNRSGTSSASVVTLEIGLPPGCDAEPKDVTGEGAEQIERGETTMVIYLRDLPPGAERTFRLAFRPRYALDVVTAPSKAYEYYVPEEAVERGPQRVRAVR